MTASSSYGRSTSPFKANLLCSKTLWISAATVNEEGATITNSVQDEMRTFGKHAYILWQLQTARRLRLLWCEDLKNSFGTLSISPGVSINVPHYSVPPGAPIKFLRSKHQIWQFGLRRFQCDQMGWVERCTTGKLRVFFARRCTQLIRHVKSRGNLEQLELEISYLKPRDSLSFNFVAHLLIRYVYAQNIATTNRRTHWCAF